MLRQHFLCFGLCPWPPALSLSTAEKSQAPSVLHPPLRYSYTLRRSPGAFSPLAVIARRLTQRLPAN